MTTSLFPSPLPAAVISLCGQYRHCLTRDVGPGRLVAAFFGVNPSYANAEKDDPTAKKWIGFSVRNDIGRFLAGNPFDYVATDVRKLATCAQPISPENARYIDWIIEQADVLIPCWGDRNKVPRGLRHHLDALRDRLFASKKPVKVFGFTKSGDPMHPLMLGYDTKLIEWKGKEAA